MTLEQIKDELYEGNRVFSGSLLYQVIFDSKVDDYFIICHSNKHRIGLYWIDEKNQVHLQGSDFFVLKAMEAKEIIEATKNLTWEEGNKFIETQTNLVLELTVENQFFKSWEVQNSREFASLTNYKKDLIDGMSEVLFGFYGSYNPNRQ